MLSGADLLRRQYHPDYYYELVASEDAPCAADVRRDVERTFPRHCLFRQQNSVGQEALFSVLKAYSLYNPEVGYCQGMGFIVGMLLMHMDEEGAFFTLAALLKKYDLTGVFQPGLPLLDRSFFVFDALLKLQAPQLAAHLAAESIGVSMYTSQWFMTLFAYNFPLATVARIWDVFLLEGISWIFRVGIAMMRCEEENLIMEGFEAILQRLKRIGGSLDPESLTKRALAVPITPKEVKKLETLHASQGGRRSDTTLDRKSRDRTK